MTGTQRLLADTSIDAIGFAQDMVDDAMWTTGRGRARAARMTRVQRLLALGEQLRLAHCERVAAKAPLDAVETLLSDTALELSALARDAEADRTLRCGIYDPWRLCNAADADADAREEASRILVLRPRVAA